MPKLVRKQPLSERISAYLNPYDFLLWLSEELESNGWDQIEKEWALPIGFGLNLIFLIARANTQTRSSSYDDVFGEPMGSSWGAWLVSLDHDSWLLSLIDGQATFLVHFLTLLSLVNAAYTFWRKKNYRLFENSVDNVPSTPSARRVKVDSSPVALSPLRFLSNIIGTDSAESRAYSDATRDVWEVAAWDPLPISLRLFCYFSPGHVFIYWLSLPTIPADPKPSVKVVTAMCLALLCSVQLSFLQSQFSQQAKDSAYISKEVLHEYDTKYVLPRTQHLYRDVATQFSEQASHTPARDKRYNNVETYTPMVVINRGFKTNPNPNYSNHTDRDRISRDNMHHRPPTTTFATPLQYQHSSSPARPLTAIRQPDFRPTPQRGDGGSLGVYSHAASPLRKSASTNFDPQNAYADQVARNRSSMSPEKRASSPDKRKSIPPGGMNGLLASQKWGHLKSDSSRRESGRF